MTMQNIDYYSPSGPGGGRHSSPKFRETMQMAEKFEGLPEDVTRFDLLKMVKRAGREVGFTDRMIQLLEYYLLFTQEQDWTNGQRPIVYQSLYKTALDFGVGERQIQKIEQALFDVGAITWNDSGNHKRYGARDEKTGEIMFAFGVDLSPLAYLYETLVQKFHEKQVRDAAWMEQKRRISWYRAQIRAFLAEYTECEQDVRPVREAIGRYNEIAIPIRTHMPLERLTELCEEHKELYETVQNTLETLSEAVDSNEMLQESTPRGVQDGAHIYSTNQTQSDKSDYSNRSGIGFQKSVADSTAQKRRRREERQAIEEKAAPISSNLSNITWKQVLNACSERFKEHIPLHERPLDWEDLVEAASVLLPDLGIHKSAWWEACRVMGRHGATICVMVIDQKAQDPENSVRNPGGYLREMTARAEKGELNLQGSVFGLLKRGEAQLDA